MDLDNVEALLTMLLQEIRLLKRDSTEALDMLRFVWSRIEDNEAGWIERDERGWHATFTYEECEQIKAVLDAATKKEGVDG
jgi:hypothetical protein